MATLYMTNYTKTVDGSREFIDVAHMGGRVRFLFDTVEIAATAGAGDLLYLAKLPSNCILLPTSNIYCDALTGATDTDIGDSNDPNGLADALNIAAGGTFAVLEEIGVEEYGDRLWEMLGYTTDPGGEIDLYMTLVSEISGAGTLTIQLFYVVD